MTDISTERVLLIVFLAILVLIALFVLLNQMDDETATVLRDQAARYWGSPA